MPPFGLFKRKASNASPAEQPIPMPTTDTLSIRQAQDMLHSIESSKVNELSVSLTRIHGTALQSLKVIDTLARDMDKESIKLEGLELRLKSVVEHAKRTVVSSLKREASSELPFPQTANDAKKFKERFENMMKRFGEVSGSHSKVLNAFMKKHSGKMKDEFEYLTKLLNETRMMIDEFDRKREPINKCKNIMNTAQQKVSAIKAAESSAKNVENRIRDIERELDVLKSEVAGVRGSTEYEQASTNMEQIDQAKKRQEEFHAKIRELFSHLSRAFTKYSYGVTKETEQHLKTMLDEPWLILYEKNVSPYSNLLREIHRSIDSGQIQLKDSDKVLQYVDTILKSLPDLQHRAQKIKEEVDLSQQLNVQVLLKVKGLEEQITQYTEELVRSKQELEQQSRQRKDNIEEVDAMLGEAGDLLAHLTGQRYSLKYD